MIAQQALITEHGPIAFWDARHGVLAARSCSAKCGSGTISLTSDGGRTFRVVLRTAQPVDSLQAVGSDGVLAQFDNGRALRTLNRGRTWRPFRLRFGASFATRKIGLGFRTSFLRNHLRLEVLATSDGGRTWRRRASPCVQAVAWSVLVDLVTQHRGWLVCLGQPGVGNEEKAVFRTTDGGRTWRAGAEIVMYPQRRSHGGIWSYGYPQGVSFAPDGFGILWESRGTLFVTRDNGRNWTAKPKVAQPEIDFGEGAAALPHGFGFVLLGRGAGPARLIVTKDYGRTWRVVHRWL